MYAKRPLICDGNPRGERGAALLLYALFLGLLGLTAVGYFVSTQSLGYNVPLASQMNKARSAASAGVLALSSYYEGLSCVDAACTSQGWNPQMALPAQGNGILPVGSQSAAITASVISDTLAPATQGTGFQGQLLVKSLGTFGPKGNFAVAADNQSILQAQFQSLNSAGGANFVLNGQATGNGRVQTAQPAIIVSTKQENEKNVTFNGSSVQFLPISQFPKIQPGNFKNVATIQLLLLGNSPVVYIPPNDLPLYASYLSSISLPTSGGLTCTGVSTCSAIMGGLGISYSNGTWSITNQYPGFFYVQGNVIVTGYNNVQTGISVAATGTIQTTGHGNRNSPVTFIPFEDPSIQPSYCSQYGGLSPCELVNGSWQSIPALQGVSFVSGGGTTVGGSNVFVGGDVASNGSLTVGGGGNKYFGGVLVANGDLTLNGAIHLTQPTKAAQQATLGRIIFQVVATRWLPY